MGMLIGAVVALVMGGLLFLTWVVFHAFLLRLLASWIAEAEIGWPMAAVSVLLASVAQGCASGVLGGADGGLLGVVVGLAAWSGVIALLNGIEFGKAALVALAMTVITWALFMVMLVGGLLALVGGAVGAGVMG